MGIKDLDLEERIIKTIIVIVFFIMSILTTAMITAEKTLELAASGKPILLEEVKHGVDIMVVCEVYPEK